MTKTFYLSDTFDTNQKWVFETLDEALAVMESMKIADSNQYPDEVHQYEITEKGN